MKANARQGELFPRPLPPCDCDPDETGLRVWCLTCERIKAPTGRAVPPSRDMCDSGCVGYTQGPSPGDMWPDETRRRFGYCCHGVFKT